MSLEHIFELAHYDLRGFILSMRLNQSYSQLLLLRWEKSMAETIVIDILPSNTKSFDTETCSTAHLWSIGDGPTPISIVYTCNGFTIWLFPSVWKGAPRFSCADGSHSLFWLSTHIASTHSSLSS